MTDLCVFARKEEVDERKCGNEDNQGDKKPEEFKLS